MSSLMGKDLIPRKGPEIAQNEIIRKGREMLTWKLVSVTDKMNGAQNEDIAHAHYYKNMGVYYWKNPQTGQYENRDGQMNPERNSPEYDAMRLRKMVNCVETLAQAYSEAKRLNAGEQEEFAIKALDFLHIWFRNPATYMKPNLEYAQCTPGQNQGTCYGIIEGRDFMRIVQAISLLEKSETLKKRPYVLRDFKLWFSAFTRWLSESAFGQQELNVGNNHSVWYNAQVATYAHFVGWDHIAAEALERAKENIRQQIAPDGIMLKELRRPFRGIHYTMFNIEAFFKAAEIGDKLNPRVDLWHYQTSDGRSIEKAVDFLAL